ncbi:hypothetical protein, partial [Methylobacterium symbioticum]|uniref:hypothetical protein n=1 Tax=Methylobacterium symbioticum TaxID=2584084 RepID=UPI001AED640E
VIEGHIVRPDTRPIEDPAEISKIMLAKQGASTHVRPAIRNVIRGSSSTAIPPAFSWNQIPSSD